VGGGRLGNGSLKLLSFNGWLIIINVAVFILGVVLSGHGVPVYRNSLVRADVPAGPTAIAEQSWVRVRGTDQYQPLTKGMSLSVRDEVRHPVVLVQTGEQIGWAIYQVMDPLNAFGHFSTYEGFRRLEVWRLVTFQFLHSGFIHLFMNMFGLWLFGGTVERHLGFKKYAAFYLVCGIFGGLLYLLLNMLGNMLTGVRIPGLLFNDTTMPLVGASAGVFGVIVACAYIEPRQQVFLMFIPVGIPLPIFAYGYVLFSLINLLTGGSNAGGDAAHVGGAIAGYYFIRHSHLLRDFFDVFGDSRATGGKRAARKAARSARKGGPPEAEVDRVLAKVNKEGLGSLNDTERKVLEADTDRRRKERT
jgi:membrane associated rhomboid family serine protease